eukprot:266119-Chlamydomonas_euryale.AAC.1
MEPSAPAVTSHVPAASNAAATAPPADASWCAGSFAIAPAEYGCSVGVCTATRPSAPALAMTRRLGAAASAPGADASWPAARCAARAGRPLMPAHALISVGSAARNSVRSAPSTTTSP